MLQSYSAVYCGDQQRSYHGTTVQLVQPNCNLVLHNIDTIATLPSTVSSEITTTHVHSVHHEQTHDQLGSPSDDNTNSSAENCQTETSNSRAVQVQCMRQFSPDSSPHKLGKVGPKRKRTVAVKNLSSLLKVVPTSSTVQSQTQPLVLADFEENEEEIKNQNTLKSKLFSFHLQKFILHYRQELNLNLKDNVLNDIRQFLDHENHGDIHQLQPSQVFYMELVNENPDSDETMTLIAEDLLDKFSVEGQDGWVLLVGDGKTYQHLMNIKWQYGTAFTKLLIFPGDWHTLKNYQPILMKVYYHAGLRELTKSCGF